MITLKAGHLEIEDEVQDVLKALEHLPDDCTVKVIVTISHLELALKLKGAGFDVELEGTEPEEKPRRQAATVRIPRGPRRTYTEDQISEVRDWVTANKAEHGRGTINMAEDKFGVPAAKIRAWVKEAKA